MDLGLEVNSGIRIREH